MTETEPIAVNFVSGMARQTITPENEVSVLQGETGPLTYDEVVDLMGYVQEEHYNPGVERLTMLEEVRRMEPLEMFERHTSKRLGEQTRRLYAKRPREYMQCDGRPYSTHNLHHYMSRYGNPHRPGIVVGVWKETPRLMMEEAARERDSARVLPLMLRMFLRENGFLRLAP